MDQNSPIANATPIGVALVLFGSASMATVATFAKLALDGGASLLTVIAIRGFVGAAIMAGVVIIAGQGFRVRKGIAYLCLLSGLAYAVMSYGLIGAVVYIPVSLVMLLFFVHPVIVAVVHHLRGDTLLTGNKFMLILAVFAGLGFALAPDLTNLDPIGIALALLAALGVTAMIFLNSRAQKETASTVITFYMTMVTVVVFTVATSATDAWVFPQTTPGWLGLWGTGLGLGFGLLAYFAAFRFIGPVRTSVISTIEPLLAILFAVAVLAETLSPLQWFGALAVVCALVFFELPSRPRKS